MGKRLESVLLPAALTAVLVAIWQGLVVASGTTVFPTPRAVLLGMEELVARGVLLSYLGDSLRRVFVGFMLAIGVGVPLGLLMGRNAYVESIFNPVIQLLRPISPIAWIPLAILFFGVSDSATFFLIFLASAFPITTATNNAVRRVPDIYVRAGRNFGLSSRQLLWRVIFPAALPEILNGVRIALGVAWLVLVAAEMIAVDSGVGYLIIDARNAGKRYDLVVAGMIAIGVVGLALDLLLRRVETIRALRWGYRQQD